MYTDFFQSFVNSNFQYRYLDLLSMITYRLVDIMYGNSLRGLGGCIPSPLIDRGYERRLAISLAGGTDRKEKVPGQFAFDTSRIVVAAMKGTPPPCRYRGSQAVLRKHPRHAFEVSLCDVYPRQRRFWGISGEQSCLI